MTFLDISKINLVKSQWREEFLETYEFIIYGNVKMMSKLLKKILSIISI
jgi:hypothetical protein